MAPATKQHQPWVASALALAVAASPATEQQVVTPAPPPAPPVPNTPPPAEEPPPEAAAPLPECAAPSRLALLAAASPPLSSLRHVVPPLAVAERAAAALHARTYHLEARFLSGGVLEAARDAAAELMAVHGQPAGVGASGGVDARIWRSEALDLLAAGRALPAPLAPLVRAVSELRAALARTSGRKLCDDIELSLLRYPPGGHYLRHTDDDASDLAPSGTARRSISLLIYLSLIHI